MSKTTTTAIATASAIAGTVFGAFIGAPKPATYDLIFDRWPEEFVFRQTEWQGVGEYPLDKVTARDNYDGDLTDKIRFSRLVDVSSATVQCVRYDVQDSSGNKAAPKYRVYWVSRGGKMRVK